jgi:LysR family transcriptional regulator for metE and metH
MKEKLSPLLRRITLKQLRAFSAVMQAGTMSGAARLLNVTPPAINLRMRLLEETAGMALFERCEDGMRPTSVGRGLLDAAARIDAAFIEFGETLNALRGGDEGDVDVGVVSTAKYFAPRALAAFAKLHPQVEMRLQVGNRGDMIAALEHHRLDFVIMGLPPPALRAEKVVIADHPHIIIAPPDHAKAASKQIPLKDLTQDTFLLRENTSGTRMLMQRLFDEAGLNPNLGMEIGSNETIKQAVMAGLGIALLSAHTVHAELQDGRLSELDVAGLPVIRQWFLVKLRKKRLLPAAQALWDFILGSSAKFLPGARQ